MIENTVIELLRDKAQVYYGQLIMRMRREFSTRVKRAGVCIKPDGVDLIINPEFWATRTPDQRIDVLIHECGHVLNLHQARKENKDHQRWNVACDRAINQLIPNMLEHFADSDMQPLFPLPGQEPLREAEYYYSSKAENDSGGGNADQTLDDHSIWADGPPMEPEAVKAVVRQLAQAAKLAAGTVPAGLISVLERLNSSMLPWRAILRRFAANSEEALKIETRSRRNRRWGIQQPGKRTEPRLRLGVIWDTSGSVSDEHLKAFLSEIDGIVSAGAHATLIQCDAAVQSIQPYKPRMLVSAKGRGGTLYAPGLAAAKAEGVDAIIYFGDMDSADSPPNPGLPVLWVSCGSKNPPANFGRLIALE